MKPMIGRAVFAIFLLSAVSGIAQIGPPGLLPTPAAPTPSTAPPFIRFGGAIKDSVGNPVVGQVNVTFSLYSDQVGGEPLWQETQVLTLDGDGRYAVFLGSTQPNGLPVELFTSGTARWIGVRAEGQAELARILLVSAPYALKAADADSLGGLPASAFLLAASSNLAGLGVATQEPTNTASQLPPDVSSQGLGSGKQAATVVISQDGVILADRLPGTGNGDIGDRIMQAYHEYCQASGCRIRIAPAAKGQCWSYTTPINFNTFGKPATLEGDPGSASCILFTPKAGSAVSLDWGVGHWFGAGVRDLTILGACTASSNLIPNCSGVTSQGLVIGLTQGVDGAFISNVNVGRDGNGFLNGVVNTGLNLITGYLSLFLNDTAIGNGTGVLVNASMENSRWIGGSISMNLIGLAVTFKGSDLGFEYISFDSNTVCAVSLTADSTLTLKNDHFENPARGTNCWMTATDGNVVWQYGDIFDDVISGTGNPPITFGGNSLVFDHVPVVTSGRAVPEIINFTTNALAYLTPFNKNYTLQPFDYVYSGPPGRVFYLPMYGASLEVPAKLAYYAFSLDSLTIGGGQKISNSSSVIQFVGAISTSTSGSDALSVSGLTASSHCSAQATNSTAAALSGVYTVAGPTSVTLYHSPTAGGTFSVFCSFD